MFAKYGITRNDMARGRWRYAPDVGAYMFPVMGPRGVERGVVLRYYDGRTNKAISYKDDPAAPWIGWYVKPKPWKQAYDRIVLVEDPVSALKLSRFVTTVCLLGTALNEIEAAEIAALRPHGVTIALDEDATNTAYRLKQTYALLFDQCDVVQLRRDVKDMSVRDIRQLFGV
jgi:DNA primase